mmetsp:Transcript_21984/g.61129  ORF Transcript_21984/g.61129 Transcript_21984/m.61129 type:complete len:246 (+) Transcript_21984:334-1071(+)
MATLWISSKLWRIRNTSFMYCAVIFTKYTTIWRSFERPIRRLKRGKTFWRRRNSKSGNVKSWFQSRSKCNCFDRYPTPSLVIRRFQGKHLLPQRPVDSHLGQRLALQLHRLVFRLPAELHRHRQHLRLAHQLRVHRLPLAFPLGEQHPHRQHQPLARHRLPRLGRLPHQPLARHLQPQPLELQSRPPRRLPRTKRVEVAAGKRRGDRFRICVAQDTAQPNRESLYWLYTSLARSGGTSHSRKMFS